MSVVPTLGEGVFGSRYGFAGVTSNRNFDITLLTSKFCDVR